MEALKTIVGAIGWLAGQVPVAISLMDSEYYIFQPGVYHDYKWLLVIPPVTGAGALIFGLRQPWAWLVLLLLFLVGLVITFEIYADPHASQANLVLAWMAFNISCSVGIIVIFLAVMEVIDRLSPKPAP
jgi:hypothetical protein